MSWLDETDFDSSNGSWIMVDDEEPKNEVKPAKEHRETVEDLDESDGISIISDPEDHKDTDSAPETTTSGSKTDEQSEPIINYKDTQLVSVEQRPPPVHGSLTSAGFMILGILIALYFQGGIDEDVARNFRYITNEIVYRSHIKQAEPNIVDEKIMNQHIKDKDYKIKDDKYKMNINIKDKYQKMYNKNQKSKWSSSEERNENHHNKKHYNHNKKAHEDYAMKKQSYVKHKEEKLKHKEFGKRGKHGKKRERVSKKYNKTMTAGDWYESLHKGRDQYRSEEKKSEWMFDRANMRKNKRDKASWYFDRMDEREHVRVKK